MGRKSKGSVLKTRDGRWQARITLADGTRKRLQPFPKGTSRAMAEEKAAKYAEQARQMGLRRSEEPKPAALPDADAPSQQLGEWLAMFFASRARTLSGDRAPNHFEKYVLPVLGHKHIDQWEAADMRRLVNHLDELATGGALSPKTAMNVWASVKAACRAACSSKLEVLRVRQDNPSNGVEPPERGAQKAKQSIVPMKALYGTNRELR